MADQVNPLGNLAAGLSPSSPVTTAAVVASHPSPVPDSSSQPIQTQAPDPKGLGAPGASAGKPSAQVLGTAAQDVKDYLQQLPTELQFRVDQGSGEFYFKVVDPSTQKVIRQVPSEELLAMARKLRAFVDPKAASGVLMDKEG